MVEADYFKLKFRQSGGIAGLIRGCDIDSAMLPKAEADELRKLIDHIDQDVSDLIPFTAIRDGFDFELTITRGGKTSTYYFTSGMIAEPIKPLLKFLVHRSVPQKLE